MILSISEILDRTSKARTVEEKVKTLQQNSCPALIWILKIAFHPDIKWLLPEGSPPYKPSEFVDVQGALRRDYRKLVYFVSNQGYENMRQAKREQIFIEMLETIDKNDALLLLALKDGKMPYKTVTARVAGMAFPGLLPEKKDNEQQKQQDVQA